MPTTTIHWAEAAPANADNLGLGAQEIRSLKTDLRTMLAVEHLFPTSSGAAGAHLAGSARAFYGLESTVSSADTDGRLMVSSDRSRLFHVGSGGTLLLGGIGATLVTAAVGGASFGGAAGAQIPQTHYMAVEGVYLPFTLSNGSTAFSYSAYSGIPMIVTGAITNTVVPLVPLVTNVTASKCSIYVYNLAASLTTNTGFTMHVLSIGSRVLG